jgi:hypothetical protein
MVALNQILDFANQRNFVFTQTHLGEMVEVALQTSVSLKKFVKTQINRVVLVNEINQLFFQAKDKFLKLNPEGIFYSHQIYENDFLRTEESLRSLVPKINYYGMYRKQNSNKIKSLKSWFKNIIRKYDLLNIILNGDGNSKSVIGRQVILNLENGVIENLRVEGWVDIKVLKGNKIRVGPGRVEPFENLK